MNVKQLNDELGKGIAVYLDGKFFEGRICKDLQSRIYGENNNCKCVIIVECTDSEKAYQQFKILTNRISYLFEISIRNKKEDFVHYLDKGFEKGFPGGKVKVNPAYKKLKKLKKWAINQGIKYGIFTEILGWIGIIAICHDLKMAAVIGGFYFVFGDIIGGFILPWLTDLNRFTSPFFLVGAYPAERHLFKKYTSLSESLLTQFRREGEKMGKLEEEFERTTNLRQKSHLDRQLNLQGKRFAKRWEPVVLSFIGSEDLKGIVIGYGGRYQDCFSFCNFMINGVEPKEEELDVWRIKIEEPEAREEADFEKVWEEEEKSDKNHKK